MSKKQKQSGCGNCGSGCKPCDGNCGGDCGDKNCKCKEVDEKGNCTGGCGKPKGKCRCKDMRTMWICGRCNTKHKVSPKKCVHCEYTGFKMEKYLPAD